MFGYVVANYEELTQDQQTRYGAVYCGICRGIREQASQAARLALSYDMAFLALLHMSLYEPEETTGPSACMLHPIKKRPWVDNEFIRYAADMNVALAYYNCLDDWEDDKNLSAKAAAAVLEASLPRITKAYPRQCAAISTCIEELRGLENLRCANPDEPANCFGRLMSELMVYQEDLWAPELRRLGHNLGRFIYLADAAMDYRADQRKNKYNPYLVMGTGEDWPRWEQYLVMAMAGCTESFEKLPLVQDKGLLDNILYSGVWTELKQRQKRDKTQEEQQ